MGKNGAALGGEKEEVSAAKKTMLTPETGVQAWPRGKIFFSNGFPRVVSFHAGEENLFHHGEKGDFISQNRQGGGGILSKEASSLRRDSFVSQERSKEDR